MLSLVKQVKHIDTRVTIDDLELAKRIRSYAESRWGNAYGGFAWLFREAIKEFLDKHEEKDEQAVLR